ncbi:hypothetical protein ARMSODRAFT_80287 [Armillaria solidipes]|uniref:Uncharacterized protein n=1 Tax=Armillaria solidipes TaxID=1076256 RepID=A0A2H3B7G6_9AGAR|nr:hypothetical protein ARMSODRAFT_80287 [Armillaria solidipes]
MSFFPLWNIPSPSFILSGSFSFFLIGSHLPVSLLARAQAGHCTSDAADLLFLTKFEASVGALLISSLSSM